MKTLFLIIIFLICLMILLGLFSLIFKKKEYPNLISSEESFSQNPSDKIFQSADKTVKIVLKTDENSEENVTFKADIYIKGRPLSIGASPLVFQIEQSSKKIPNKKNILKRIYFIATSKDFLYPFFSSKRLKERLLRRIYTIRAKNIQQKIFYAIKALDPLLFQNLRKKQKIELKMKEALLQQARSTNQNIPKRSKEIDYEKMREIEVALSNESLVNVLPQNEVPHRRLFEKDGRS